LPLICAQMNRYLLPAFSPLIVSEENVQLMLALFFFFFFFV
jgi:hypothetical protein